MRASRISVPLFVGIVGAIGFNFSPILLGYGMAMNACFLAYASTILFLSFADSRVLGYATVLSACNPANSLANLSFSLLLALLTIIKEYRSVRNLISELGSCRWWLLMLGAFALIIISVPAWSTDMNGITTEVKQALSRLGFIVVFPVAIALTIRSRLDGVRVVSLLFLLSVSIFSFFYFTGQTGTDVITAVKGGDNVGVEQHIGNIYMNFVRTQVCIPIAALVTVGLALAIGAGITWRGLQFFLAICLIVLMIMQLASTGSAFAMVCGMGVIAFG
jgi:hypothetical protein